MRRTLAPLVLQRLQLAPQEGIHQSVLADEEEVAGQPEEPGMKAEALSAEEEEPPFSLLLQRAFPLTLCPPASRPPLIPKGFFP